MAIDRKRFKQPFTKGSVPPWNCPRCFVGTLRLLKDSLHEHETRDSRDARGHEAWEPEWIDHRFACLMVCNRPECDEVVAVAGTTGLTEEYDAATQDTYISHAYRPGVFFPAIPLFPLPADCPDAVREDLDAAFGLFWTEPAAAVNRVRGSIEHLLTWLEVPQFIRDKKGKRQRLTAHARIQSLATKFPQLSKLSDMLMAAKWVGNEGSHSGAITQDDVFDSLDLVQYVLDEVVEDRTSRIERLSKSINKRKGPIRRKPK